jgi:hypothetical protein
MIVIILNDGDFYFLLLRVAADLDAKTVKHQDKQATLQKQFHNILRTNKIKSCTC